MPRLGDEPSDEEIRPLNRRQAVAYPGGDNQSRTFVYTILLFLAMFWIVPNFFFRDYREEALESLRASGKTEEQIEQWFPKSIREKRKEQMESYAALKDEVADLRKRLEALESHVNIPNRTVDGPQ